MVHSAEPMAEKLPAAAAAAEHAATVAAPRAIGEPGTFIEDLPPIPPGDAPGLAMHAPCCSRLTSALLTSLT